MFSVNNARFKPAGRRGRPRLYGVRAIDLAKRAGQARGWSRGAFDLYDGTVVERHKTFLATWRPAGGWRAYFGTDPKAAVADTLTEAWAWRQSEAALVDRTDSPWDSPDRRPSHADKRRAWRREMLAGEILAILRAGPTAAERLLRLAA